MPSVPARAGVGPSTRAGSPTSGGRWSRWRRWRLTGKAGKVALPLRRVLLDRSLGCLLRAALCLVAPRDLAVVAPVAAYRDGLVRDPEADGFMRRAHAFMGRFVSYPSEHAHVAHVLWVAHTQLMGAWAATPRLAFLSAEPASGKTPALEISEPLVPSPIMGVTLSAHALAAQPAHRSGARSFVLTSWRGSRSWRAGTRRLS